MDNMTARILSFVLCLIAAIIAAFVVLAAVENEWGVAAILATAASFTIYGARV